MNPVVEEVHALVEVDKVPDCKVFAICSVDEMEFARDDCIDQATGIVDELVLAAAGYTDLKLLPVAVLAAVLHETPPLIYLDFLQHLLLLVGRQ